MKERNCFLPHIPSSDPTSSASAAMHAERITQNHFKKAPERSQGSPRYFLVLLEHGKGEHGREWRGTDAGCSERWKGNDGFEQGHTESIHVKGTTEPFIRSPRTACTHTTGQKELHKSHTYSKQLC